MKKYAIIFLSLLLSLSLTAQKEASYWFFGEFAGIDFNSGSPVALTTGALTTWEGCSSISNSSGILRFYTDGSTVWNRNNVPMPGGSGLSGDPSSTQSGLVVPWPGQVNKYLIFTIDEVNSGGGPAGLRYTVVDMNLQGFLGDVIPGQKNILLTAPMCEKLTAVGHDNGNDTWVISQKWGTNEFYSYLVTFSGVNETPVISSGGGAIIEGGIDNAKGYLKVSPDGTKLAKANAGLKSLELFSFDNSTAAVNYILTDYGLNGEPYGIEFSPNSKLLYVNTWKSKPQQKLYQYNLEAGTPTDIKNSRVQIASGTNGALQLAPDNKIYVAMNNSGYLSVINVPNKLGAACLYNANEVYLAGKSSRYGLPPFIQSFFSFNAGYYNETPCYTIPTQFYENSSVTPDSVYWNFGDMASGSDNYSTEFDPNHLFTSPGLFFVKHVIWIEGLKDSLTNAMWVLPLPEINLGNDTSFCEGDPLLLDAGEGFETYLWNNGDTTRTITVTLAGEYSCEVADGRCSNSDTIQVLAFEKPNINLGNDVSLCAGGFYTIDAGAGYESYLWPNGSTQQTYSVEETGTYWVEVTNDLGCPNKDTVTVTFHANPIADAGPVQTIDQGQTTVLEGSVTGGLSPYTYDWQPASMLVQNDIAMPVTQPITTPTWFTLNVSDSRNCVAEESEVLINLTGSTLWALPTANPDTICLGESTDITAYATGGGLEYTYAWTGNNPPGFTSPYGDFTVTPTAAGTVTYNLLLKDQFDNQYNGTATVVVKPLPVIDLIPDGIVPIAPDTIVICVRDSVMLDAGQDTDPDGTTYFWTESNYLNRYFKAKTNGNWLDFQTHQVRVNYPGADGCESQGEITIVFDFNECQIGIDENELNQLDFQLFPNPNNGTFTLYLNKEMRNMEVRVYDFTGKPVYNELFNGKFIEGHQQLIELDLVKKGVYFVQLLSEDSSHSIQKVVIR